MAIKRKAHPHTKRAEEKLWYAKDGLERAKRQAALFQGKVLLMEQEVRECEYQLSLHRELDARAS